MAALPLEGRNAVVTGASRGIGAATAEALDRAGARVALLAREAAALEAVAAGLVHHPVVVPVDLGSVEALARAVDQVLEAMDGADILVNNAATAYRLRTVETTAQVIDHMLAVNVRAPLLLIAALVPSMVDRGGGSVVNITSVSGLLGTPNRAAYAASKGAMDAATRSLAKELGPLHIRVNAVAPGVVDTDLWAENKAVPGVVEAIEAATPLGRWAQPEDIADVVVFLAGDGARFITGETISADGGMARTMDLYPGPT